MRLNKIFTGSIFGILTAVFVTIFLLGVISQTKYGSRISEKILGKPDTVFIDFATPAEQSQNATSDIPGRVGPKAGNFEVHETLTITENDVVIENVDVAGEIRVVGDNVTIRNFRANNVAKEPGYVNLTLEDGEIHGKKDPTAHGVTYSDYTARRLNIYGVEDGFKAHGNVVIENCWVHDLAFFEYENDTSHNDGVQVSSGSNVTVKNSLFENIKGTAAVFIKPDQGVISDIEIDNNILGGGAYTLYVISTTEHGYPNNVRVTNNTFLNENLFGHINIEQRSTVFTGNKTASGGDLRL